MLDTASKQTYECYVCKRNGFEDVRVYLDGKTEDGKTVYKNEDMSAHQHKQKQQGQQQQQNHGGSTMVVSEPTQLKIVAARLEYAISLLEKLTQVQQQQHV